MKKKSTFVWRLYTWQILWLTLVPIPYRKFETGTFNTKDEADREAYRRNKALAFDVYLVAKRKRKRLTRADKFEILEPKKTRKQ